MGHRDETMPPGRMQVNLLQTDRQDGLAACVTFCINQRTLARV